MKALSIKEPYASLIADGRKTIETRTWWSDFRGPLLICASKKPDVRLAGHAVAIVTVTDWRRMQPSDKSKALCDYGPDRYAVVLENLWKLSPPLVASGALYLWDVNNELVQGWTSYYESQYLKGCFKCPFANYKRLGASMVCNIEFGQGRFAYKTTEAPCLTKGISGDDKK